MLGHFWIFLYHGAVCNGICVSSWVVMGCLGTSLHGLAFLDCKGFATRASIGPLGMRSTTYLSALHCRTCVTSALICLRAHGLTLWYCLCGKMTL